MKNLLMNSLFLALTIACVENGSATIEVAESTKSPQTSTSAPNEQGPGDLVVTYEQLKQKVLDPLRCAGCHVDMKTEQGLQKYLNAGEPFSSPLYLRVENGTMPPFGDQASSEQLELIESYITDLQTAQIQKIAHSNSCQYEVGSCMYYIACRRQWPPVGCTDK